MKRIMMLVLAVCLVITSILPLNPNSANAEGNDNVQRNTESIANQDGEVLSIPLLENQFQVSEAWILAELNKGYDLLDIYQGLIIQQRDNVPYETTMLEKFSHKLDSIVVNQSVTDDVYSKSVISDVYQPLKTVTDSTYSMFMRSNELVQKINIKPEQAPYKVDFGAERVSTVNGSLNIAVDEVTLPGRNGMNFTLKRVFDASAAKDTADIDYYPSYDMYTVVNKQPDEEKMFPIGKGWTWDISYMKNMNGQKQIYIAGKGTYAISSNDTLIGYPWRDMLLIPDDSASLDGRKSVYRLQQFNGISQFFDAEGNLIQMKDFYGNSINFHHAWDDKYGWVLSSIVNSENSGIFISFTEKDVTITIARTDRQIVYKKSKVDNKEVLDEVIDSMGRSTKYFYAPQRSVHYSKGGYTHYGQSNTVFLMSRIIHPTNAVTRYAYEQVRRKIAKDVEELSYRMNFREDFYETTDERFVANRHDFTYQGDIGEKFEQDHNFSTTVDDGLVKTTFNYFKDYINSSEQDVLYNTQTTAQSGSQRRDTIYTYDQLNRRTAPIRIEERNYNGSSASRPRVTTRSYDQTGAILTETNPLGITTVNNYKYIVEDKNGYEYIMQVLMNSSTPVNAVKNQYNEFEYNTKGSLTQHTVKENSTTGSLFSQVNNTYDRIGNNTLIQMKDDSRLVNIEPEYDPSTSSVFLMKQKVDVSNIDGEVSSVIQRMSYNSYGEMAALTDGEGNQTKYEYDKLGRIVSAINPDSSRITVQYDDLNNTVTLTDPTGVKSVLMFDPLGRKFKETQGSGYSSYGYDNYNQLVWSQDARGNRTSYHYDAWGRHTLTTYADSSQSTVIYDDINNTVTSVDGENNTIKESYDLLNRLLLKEQIKSTGTIALEKLEYDYAGNVVASVDANNARMKYDYDILGRITSVTDAEGKTTKYTYSLLNNLVQIQYPDQTIVKKRFDELGRLIQKTDQLGQHTKYYYDTNGNMVKLIDRNGQITENKYNNRGFRIQNITSDETITYRYDLSGKRLSMLDRTGETKYAYSPIGDLSSVEYPDLTKLDYKYDIQGVVGSSLTEANKTYNLTTEGSFNNKNLLSKFKISNHNNKIEEIGYTYLRNGIPSKETTEKGLSTDYSYTDLSMTGLMHKQGASTLNAYDYRYDNNRNIVGRTENGSDTSFSYDLLNRIKTSSQFNESYSYDARDNRLILTSDQAPSMEGMSYSYDIRNRLTNVTTNDGKIISYRYNGDGLLVERVENGVTSRYYYDANSRIIGESVVDSNGVSKLSYAYVYDLKGKLIARQIVLTGQLEYYLLNGHGDVVELRDAAGNILNKYTYDIWGNPLSESEQAPNIFRYSGEYWDSTTGLQYLRARWYDPSVGRFINEDTYEGKLNDPLSLNLYTYVSNNPLKYIDPSGHIQMWGAGFAGFPGNENNVPENPYKGWWAGTPAGKVADFLILDDLATLYDSDSSTLNKSLSAFSLIPGAGKLMGSGFKAGKNAFKAIVKPVSNMSEFFKMDFGQSISKSLSKSKVKYDGQSIYEVVTKTDNPYLKKGYGVYLDAMHKDHLEVIDKMGNVKYVLNLDGTLNSDKTKKALGRTVKDWR